MQRSDNELTVFFLETMLTGATFTIQRNHLEGQHRHMISGSMPALLEANRNG